MLEILFALLILTSHASLLLHYEAILDYYYISLSVILSILLLYRLLRTIEWKLCLADALIFSSVSLLGILTLNVKSLWLDEYTQILSSSRIYYCLTCSSAIEQQTPLSYGLLSFALSVFGKSVFGVRLLSCLFFAGSCVYLKRVLVTLNVSRFLVGLAVVLYIFNLQTYGFFSEVKPYSLFLYCSLWALSLFVNTIYEEHKVKISFLLPALFFLSMSIGLQAQLFLVALVAGHIIHTPRKIKKELVVSSTLALLLSTPIIWNIYQWSQEYNQFYSDYSFNFSDLYSALKVYLDSSTGFLMILSPEVYLGLALFGIMVFRGNLRTRYLLFTFFVFSLLFFGAYNFLINWKLLTKYHLISLVMVLIAVLSGYSFGYRRLSWAWPRSFKVILAIVVSLRISIYLLNFEQRSHFLIDSRALPWKSFYEDLQELVKNDDVVYFLSLKAIGDWNQTYPIGIRFYIPPGKVKVYRKSDQTNLPLYENTLETKGDILIVSAQKWSSDTIDDELLSKRIKSLSVHYISGIRVFKLNADGRSRNERLIDFFSKTLDIYGQFSWSAPLWASLAQMYKLTSNREAHQETLKKFSQLYLPLRKNEDGAVVDRQAVLRDLIDGLSFE